MKPSRIRRIYDIKGVVQGIGFRPTLFRLAERTGLGGWVQNRSESVRLAIEGQPSEIDAFVRDLPANLPPNARIESLTVAGESEIAETGDPSRFVILSSPDTEQARVRIPADLAGCPDCMAEITDPADRRYGYPFTTCTHCGPRYTVVNAMPYDRERTTLSAFPMCPACRREYDDPRDRRFHAETTACAGCGPHLFLEAADGTRVQGDALAMARQELARGHVLAVRGIGGYLLAADAFNRNTLRDLRQRKHRPHKPFAVMAPNLDTLSRYCEIPREAKQLLLAPESPIVIVDVRPKGSAADRLPLDLIAPDAMTLGVMLPTSPLHKLLLTPLRGEATPAFELLIMTSGNRGGEPICIANDEARARLRTVADFLLGHDREINLRNDDSLCIIQRGGPQVWRRARGYAPNPIALRRPLRRCVLAMGAEIKNTIALGFESEVVMSPHVGDLETPEALDGLERVAACLPAFLNRSPEAVAVDLNPDMHSSITGRRIAEAQRLPVVEIQHHHAHAVACLAEHGHESGLALVYDGTGLGTDHSIWGAELLDVTPEGYRRLATFAAVPLPGGDAAVRRPARQLVARWTEAGLGVSAEWRQRLGITEPEAAAWAGQCRERWLAPMTHAAGRVFDAFAALLGIAPAHTTYEGQPAIRLEAAARKARGAAPQIPVETAERNGMLQIDWSRAFAEAADIGRIGGQEAEWAMAFHEAVGRAALAMIEYGVARSHSRVLALSGGVFMNRILNDWLVTQAEKLGLEVLIHRLTPPNDGCISMGQAVVAGR